MINVLFVCLGNICRSPMAEAIFRNKVEGAGLETSIKIDSAGTGDWHVGSIPHEGTREVLKTNNISYDGMKARQVNKSDFSQFNYIIAMDTNNLNDLKRLSPNAECFVGRMLDFVEGNLLVDVPDPYYTGNFEEVYQLLDEACDNLLTFIRDKEGV